MILNFILRCCFKTFFSQVQFVLFCLYRHHLLSLPNNMEHLNAISRLTEANLTLSMKKLNFFKWQLKMIDPIVLDKGLEIQRRPMPIAEYPPPNDLKALQCFLGLVGWCHKFIPLFAEFITQLKPLKEEKRQKGMNPQMPAWMPSNEHPSVLV